MSGITICVMDTSKMSLEDMLAFIESSNREPKEADLLKEFDSLRNQYMKEVQDVRDRYEGPMRAILSKIQQARAM